jgi:hypothetical protein
MSSFYEPEPEVKDDQLSLDELSNKLSELLLIEETETAVFIHENKNVISATVHYNNEKKDLEIRILYQAGTQKPLSIPNKWTKLVPFIVFIEVMEEKQKRV